MNLKSPFDLKQNETVNTTSKIVDTQYCPECNTKMPILKANGVSTYTCIRHRISLPVPEQTEKV